VDGVWFETILAMEKGSHAAGVLGLSLFRGIPCQLRAQLNARTGQRLSRRC
jgi:hypothetical protein